MKVLTLVRHAKSSWADSGLSDRERPLNARGKRDAPKMGGRIKAAGIRPSLIVMSPAQRTRTTARIIAREIGYPVEFLQIERELYMASLHDLLDVIVAQDDGFHSLMLVAHNPGLTQLANYLVPGITNNLPTCGVVSVEFDLEHWRLHDQPEVNLLTFDYPKLRHSE